MSSLFARSVRLTLFAMAALCGFALAAASASAMDFHTAQLSSSGACKGRRCPSVMVASGEITSGTLDKFAGFLQQASRQGASNVLILDSPGGQVVESLRMGLVLRKLRTSVFVGRVTSLNGQTIVVNGACMSACVYMMMGGSKRFVSESSRIGVHREFLPNSTGSDPLSVLRSTQRFPEVANLLKAYSQHMGISPSLIDLAEQYGGGGIRILTPQDITRYRLAKISK
jgi:hypothetical protein